MKLHVSCLGFDDFQPESINPFMNQIVDKTCYVNAFLNSGDISDSKLFCVFKYGQSEFLSKLANIIVDYGFNGNVEVGLVTDYNIKSVVY